MGSRKEDGGLRGGVKGLRQGLGSQGVRGLRGQVEGLRGVGAWRGSQSIGGRAFGHLGMSQIYRGHLNIWGVYGCLLSLHKQAS